MLSPGNLWNGFIMCMVIFFVVTIIDQVAIATQASLDEAEVAALEAAAAAGKAAAATGKASAGKAGKVKSA